MRVFDLSQVTHEPATRSDLQDLALVEPPSGIASVAVDAATVDLAVARTKVLLAGYAVGAARRVTELSVKYAGERQQFGKPIGSFQAIAHRCVDMHTVVASADMLVSLSAWQLSTGRHAQGWRSASLAKADATAAFADVTASALQLFGGHGFSLENDVQLFFRLARGLEVTWGTPSQEREAAGRPIATAPGEFAS